MSGIMSFMLINLKLISILSFLCISYSTEAQILQSARFEVELDSEDDFFNVAPAGSDGLVLFRNKAVSGGGNTIWQFKKLDFNLNEQWNSKILLNSFSNFRLQRSHEQFIYFLFTKSNSFNLDVIRFDISTGQETVFKINNHIPVNISEFEIVPEGILVGGSYNMRPVVLYYSFSTSRSLFLPNVFSVKGNLHHISPDADGNINVLTSGLDHVKREGIFLYTFDSNGKMINQNLLFSSSPKRALQSGKIINLHNKKIIAGTYGKKRSEFSQGIFLADLEESEVNLRFYNYADLPNFFNYMRPGRLERIKNRITRRRDAGKNIKFNYRMRINDIFDAGDHHVLIGESFYPKYKSYSPYGYNSFRSYYSGHEEALFDGYYYSHAVVVGLNNNGEIMWDNSIRIKDVKQQSLDRVVNIAVDESNLLLIYSYNNELRTKEIHKNHVVEEKKSSYINLKHAADEVKNNSSRYKGGILRGGENILYAYGVQTIKNMKDDNVKHNREVFFINKVIYK